MICLKSQISPYRPNNKTLKPNLAPASKRHALLQNQLQGLLSLTPLISSFRDSVSIMTKNKSITEDATKSIATTVNGCHDLHTSEKKRSVVSVE